MEPQCAAPSAGYSRHFIPQLILKRFRNDSRLSLDVLDKKSGSIERRKIKKIGKIDHLWSQKLEDGIFNEMDNAAGRIFRYKLRDNIRAALYLHIDERRKINERRKLSEWLMLFAVRVPSWRNVCHEVVQQWRANPVLSIQVLQQHIDAIMDDLKQRTAERYEHTVRQLGEESFKLAMFEILKRRIADHPEIRKVIQGQSMFENMIESDKHRPYSRYLYNLKWTWLKTNGEFVIGDNPLCRWDHRRGGAGLAVARRHVEITIPLSRQVTLWMHRNYRHADFAICNRSRTRELNRRQIASAAQFVYGPSKEALGG
jgi:hypothetical protein